MVSIVGIMLSSMITLGSVLAQDGNFTSPTLQSITYGGSGCPQGSMKFSVPINSTRYIVAFGGYAASIGAGAPLAESRKNCQINLKLDYPVGYQYAVAGNTYSGYASLDAGVSAVHKSIYYFSGYEQQSSTQMNFTGPYNAAYAAEDSVLDETSWSPCGTRALLNINNQVRMTRESNSTGSGTLYDSGLFDVSLMWRTCAE
ncbi:hypothetical protein IFR04_013974 [Cadophora malorum]|uniref:Secreted protein n=1 Tax=Cadophora malorum TaxID=108018 RepID=A0A8H7W0T7_9HELO|nr:hypothetical protein IFR04_013974 [Cadophora malorum]